VDVYRRYDSIYCLKKDGDPIGYGDEDNRPCHGGYTKLHKLKCGHIIFTPKATVCVGNCYDQLSWGDYLSFFCLFCARYGLRIVKEAPLKRWHDLLLAFAAQTAREVAKWAAP
jgi:hypothetical protein